MRVATWRQADERGSQVPTASACAAPGAGYAVELYAVPPVPTGPRPWKCRTYGNHKPISTGPWKSRIDREIPTFPPPILSVSFKKNKTGARTLRVRRRRRARHGIAR